LEKWWGRGGPTGASGTAHIAGYGAMGIGVKRVVMCVRSGGLGATVVEGDL
jgi:hypothetical protein